MDRYRRANGRRGSLGREGSARNHGGSARRDLRRDRRRSGRGARRDLRRVSGPRRFDGGRPGASRAEIRRADSRRVLRCGSRTAATGSSFCRRSDVPREGDESEAVELGLHGDLEPHARGVRPPIPGPVVLDAPAMEDAARRAASKAKGDGRCRWPASERRSRRSRLISVGRDADSPRASAILAEALEAGIPREGGDRASPGRPAGRLASPPAGSGFGPPIAESVEDHRRRSELPGPRRGTGKATAGGAPALHEGPELPVGSGDAIRIPPQESKVDAEGGVGCRDRATARQVPGRGGPRFDPRLHDHERCLGAGGAVRGQAVDSGKELRHLRARAAPGSYRRGAADPQALPIPLLLERDTMQGVRHRSADPRRDRAHRLHQRTR